MEDSIVMGVPQASIGCFFFFKPSLHWMIEGYHHFRKPPYKLGQMGSEKKQLPGALKYLEVTRMDGFYIFE